MRMNNSHDCSKWKFKNSSEILKKKSKLLVKKHRILESKVKSEFVFDQYVLWKVQYEKFKALFVIK